MPGNERQTFGGGQAASIAKVLFTWLYQNATNNGKLSPVPAAVQPTPMTWPAVRKARHQTRPHGGPANTDTDSRPQGDGELILVVEITIWFAVTLERLEVLGYAVIEARSGPEAIERLKSDEPIALVFSDIVMPGGMTGHDLRAGFSRKACVKVLLTSGYNAERGDDAIAHIKVLAKPYTFTQLARSMHEALHTESAQADVTSPVNT
jgi:CheY-like chemotaxis protein